MTKPLTLLMRLIQILLMCLLSVAGSIQAHEAHTKHDNSQQKLAVSVEMDDQKRLWRASVQDGFVLVAVSDDLGKTFSQAVKVNPKPMRVAARGEARPKIAVTNHGHVYLTWTESLKQRFAGYIWFARSLDGGKTFEKPYVVHQDRSPITHRFDALNVADNGKITVTWIDKRDLKAAKAKGKPYHGAAVYYAVSDNAGESFAPELKLADSSCECCRIATTNKPDGTMVAMWRHVFGDNQRDHMISEIPAAGKPASPHRATFGRWKINGCPHHGPSLARGGEGENWWGYHMAYFDGKDKKPGLYYARMDGVAWASVPPKRFGNFEKQAGHPVLLSLQDGDDEKVWLVWREINGKHNQILVKTSQDGGRSWTDANTVAQTKGKSDYPHLVHHQTQAYLVWNTQARGLHVMPLNQ